MPTPSEPIVNVGLRGAQPPAPTTDPMIRAATYHAFAGALTRGGGEAASPQGLRELRLALAELGVETPSGDVSWAQRDEDWNRLFGHTVRSDVTPYETEYGTNTLFQQPQELADLAGFYTAFGLALAPDESERVDHIGCELEFMSFLCAKEAWCEETGDLASRDEIRYAQRQFMRDHLGRFAPSFAVRLHRKGEGTFYGAVGLLLGMFVSAECGGLGTVPGNEDLGLRLPSNDNVPSACGTDDACNDCE